MPNTLHPTRPHALHPTTYSLHSTPHTPHPTPEPQVSESLVANEAIKPILNNPLSLRPFIQNGINKWAFWCLDGHFVITPRVGVRCVLHLELVCAYVLHLELVCAYVLAPRVRVSYTCCASSSCVLYVLRLEFVCAIRVGPRVRV